MRKYLSLVLIAASAPAWACAVCFGAADSGQTHGMNAGILTLLGTTLGVLALCVCVALRIALRIRRAERETEPEVPDAEVDLA